MLKDYNYELTKDSPETLAGRIINQLEVEGLLSFPIDPFLLLKRFGIEYKLMDFEDLEGIYITDTDNSGITIVGINKNRPLTRQRFTAAHEICHHIKDRERETILCPIDGRKNEIEKFADRFASALLLPTSYLRAKVDELKSGEYVSFDDALRISLHFGVSFQACIYSLAYRLKVIDGDINSDVLNARIKKYKPQSKLKELGLTNNFLELKLQMIQNYSFRNYVSEELIWYKFKSNYIANEEKLEGSKLEIDHIFEMVTDLRINRQNSEYSESEYQNVMEVAGQIEMFDYIFTAQIDTDGFPLKELHRKLYRFSNFPEFAGAYRTENNIVYNSNLETSDYSIIYNEMYLIENDIFSLINNIDDISISEFIFKAAIIHHRITVIHPFIDGNGRVSRGLLNWLLHLKGMYPFYIKVENKKKYLFALETADSDADFSLLVDLIIDEIIESDILLNSSNPK